jgi:acyl dehydratase
MHRYFEDWTIGDRLTTGSLSVSEESIVAFAREYDPQAFHLDPESARTTPIGRLIASGWQTTAWTMRMIVDSGTFGETGALGVGVDELRWRRPVFPGDTLHVEAEVVELRPSASKPSGIVRIKLTTYNQNQEAVLTMTTAVIYPRRPAA